MRYGPPSAPVGAKVPVRLRGQLARRSACFSRGYSMKTKVSKVSVLPRQCFIFGALFPSKSGLIPKHFVKHIS